MLLNPSQLIMSRMRALDELAQSHEGSKIHKGRLCVTSCLGVFVANIPGFGLTDRTTFMLQLCAFPFSIIGLILTSIVN